MGIMKNQNKTIIIWPSYYAFYHNIIMMRQMRSLSSDPSKYLTAVHTLKNQLYFKLCMTQWIKKKVSIQSQNREELTCEMKC